MIESRRNELQSKAIEPDRWNNREADRQAEKAFLEEHKEPGKFSGKYGTQPTQTELVWRMTWGCWLEYNDGRMLSEAWNAATKEFSEDWPSTTVHRLSKRSCHSTSRRDCSLFHCIIQYCEQCRWLYSGDIGSHDA